MKNKATNRDALSILISTASWLIIMYLALPLLVIVAVSFTETGYLIFPPQGFTWKWYIKFLDDPSFVESIILSTLLGINATVVAVFLGLPVAFILARKRFPGRNFLSSFFLSPLMLPTIIVGVGMLEYASIIGFARTYWALLAAHSVIVIPYLVRTSLASLSGLNQGTEEAALDLGASRVQTFLLITLPQIKPGVISGALFALIVSWVNVEVSIFNSAAGLNTMPVKLFNHIQYNLDPMVAAVSAATIYVSIVVVVLIDLFIGIDKAATGG